MSIEYPFRLYPLPWSRTDLSPFLSGEAISFHYDRHHSGYVNKMNELAEQYPELQMLSLMEIVDQYPSRIGDIAAQILNHNFFWNTLSPNPGNPEGRLYQMISQQFGSYEKFEELFTQRATEHFGSGWVWLVYDPRTTFLLVIDGKDSYNPIVEGYVPLMNLDVWEHSYYPDYINNVKDYVKNFWQFVNWNRINKLAAEEIFGNNLSLSPRTV